MAMRRESMLDTVARLELEVARLREALDARAPTTYFLDWVADRLVYKHGEDPNVDFVQALRRKARLLQVALGRADDDYLELRVKTERRLEDGHGNT